MHDAGAVALAQALHHNSTLKGLHLNHNDGIGANGTRQFVQALTVNTSISKSSYIISLLLDLTGGLLLPHTCMKYATQCTQYDTVKFRIGFSY